MSDYTPTKVDDEVEVVLRGKVAWVGQDGRSVGLAGEANNHPVYLDHPAVVSVEKVSAPIPTTPGTVLDVGGDIIYERWDYGWRTPGSTVPYMDAEVQELADRLGFTVLRPGNPEADR